MCSTNAFSTGAQALVVSDHIANKVRRGLARCYQHHDEVGAGVRQPCRLSAACRVAAGCRPCRPACRCLGAFDRVPAEAMCMAKYLSAGVAGHLLRAHLRCRRGDHPCAPPSAGRSIPRLDAGQGQIRQGPGGLALNHMPSRPTNCWRRPASSKSRGGASSWRSPPRLRPSPSFPAPTPSPYSPGSGHMVPSPLCSRRILNS